MGTPADTIPSISVVVCTYNRAGYLEDTLRTLRDQKGVEHGAFEIVVVDNNSSDETSSTVSRFQAADPDAPVRYVFEAKQGLSHARNRGIEEARAPIIAFVDDDIFASEELVEAYLSFFADHPSAAAAGGPIEVHYDDGEPPWASPRLIPLLGHHDLGRTVRPYDRHRFPFGGNMCFRKETFERVGVFDVTLGRAAANLLASEEKDLFLRIRAAGLPIHYVPRARLRHRVAGERLTDDFVRKQATGIGRSERLRVRNAGLAATIAKVGEEFVKGGGTLVLAIGYLLKAKTAKASMLLKFRLWVWKGLWCG